MPLRMLVAIFLVLVCGSAGVANNQGLYAIKLYGSTSATGTTSLTTTFTPAGGSSVRGVVVMCQCNTATDCTSDVFSGATYGGISMTQIANAADTVGEPGFVEAYFLGSGIPQGAQTVTCTVSAGSSAKFMGIAALTGVGDMSSAGSCTITTGDPDDPSCTISSITAESFVVAGIHSGLAAPTNITSASGVCCISRHGTDYGAQAAAFGFQRFPAIDNGNQTAQFITTAADDVAMVAVAVQVP